MSCNVEVKLQTKFESDSSNQEFEYIAFVTCPICGEIIKLKQYYLRKTSSKPQWCRSNFERHLKTHLVTSTNKKSRTTTSNPSSNQNSNMKISNIFKIINKSAATSCEINTIPINDLSQNETENRMSDKIVILENWEIPVTNTETDNTITEHENKANALTNEKSENLKPGMLISNGEL